MTALMVLFLLVMSVALLSVTKTVSEIERLKVQRLYRTLTPCWKRSSRPADRYPGHG